MHTLTQITFTFVTHLDKTRNPKRCVVYFRHLFHPQNSCLYTDFLINRYSTSDSNLNSLKTEKMSYNEMCSDGKHSILQNYYYAPISSGDEQLGTVLLGYHAIWVQRCPNGYRAIRIPSLYSICFMNNPNPNPNGTIP